jgi:hypothetical protein
MHPTTQRPADLHDWLVAHDPIRVTALIEANLDQDGFDVRGIYVETDGLKLLGPSTTRFTSMGRPSPGTPNCCSCTAWIRRTSAGRNEGGKRVQWRVGVYAADHEGP